MAILCRRQVVYFGVLCVSSIPLFAKEQDWGFESTRAWGRGGSFVAAYDSDEATIFNPATLAEPKINYQLRWYQLDGNLSANTLSTVKDITSSVSGSGGSSVFSPIMKHFVDNQHIKAQGNLLAQRFGAFELTPQFYTKADIKGETPQVPSVHWHSDTVLGLGYSYARMIKPNLYLGGTLTPFERIYIDGTLGLADLTAFFPPATAKIADYVPVKKGKGITMDLGMIWQVRPNVRLGAVYKNLAGGYYFSQTEALPPKLDQRINLGALYRTPLGRGFSLDVFGDLQGLLSSTKMGFVRMIHTGVEVARSYATRDQDFGVTGGINEGYFTYGAFLNLYFMRIDFARYAVELGEAAGQLQDKRWSLSVRSSMTF